MYEFMDSIYSLLRAYLKKGDVMKYVTHEYV